MFDQCLTANSNVSWSSSAWDCTEAWEVVSLFVIRISLWHNFSRSSKKYKKAPLSTWNCPQGNSSSSPTQSSDSSWRPPAIETPRLAQRTMSMWRGEGLQNVFLEDLLSLLQLLEKNDQTWNLSKILHDHILGPKLLHNKNTYIWTFFTHSKSA